MAETLIARSVTSERSNTQGKECTVGRYLSEAEGWKIVEVAATWEGTPYQMVGARSEKGIVGDCSGTTFKIYTEAGFPYGYRMTADFVAYVTETNRFREIDPATQPMQAGDVLFWTGHMAIFAPFPEGHPKRETGVMKAGKAIQNNMYTAFNAKRNVPYGPYNIATFRGDKYRVFRYFFLPGEAGCK
ncbi:hypothetical protein GCM10025771_07970 [Niveibacterium umoris]|uniref:NlpC/P60 domain-containing protein n=1 Tax=Niveibacterium umoris TaxID=1193620 RepID=A0A840BS51_9RHOO|nr:C40 family peptidase [Niveibacterium umoris]MBB4013656.1 hypothetical protein [Niveibacterium umoris]